MSTPEDTGGTVWDAPNQQVVRPDESPPWEEGDGGSENPEPKSGTAGYQTKAELTAEAESLGIDTSGMTRDDLLAAIAEAESS